jgi:hypothetical protein
VVRSLKQRRPLEGSPKPNEPQQFMRTEYEMQGEGKD